MKSLIIAVALSAFMLGCSHDPVSPPSTGEPTLGGSTAGEPTTSPVPVSEKDKVAA